MSRAKKRKIRKILYSWPVVAVLLLILIVLVMSTWDVFVKYTRSAYEVQQAEGERQELLERRAELENDIAHLQSERGIEEEIRDKFNVAKEGEEVVVIVDGPEQEVVEENEPQSFWQRMWGNVTKRFR